MAQPETLAQGAHKMNHMKILLAIFFFVSLTEISYSQSNGHPLTHLEDIKRIIAKNYKVESGFVDTACLNTFFIVKFSLKDNLPDSIEFTKSVPQPIKRAIVNSLHMDKNEFQLDKQKYKDKAILVPIHIVYSNGCKIPSSAVKIDETGKLKSYWDFNSHEMGIAFLNLLYFESGGKALFEGIILSPMQLATFY